MLKRLSQLLNRFSPTGQQAESAGVVSSSLTIPPFDPVRVDKHSLIALNRQAATLTLSALKVRAQQSGQYLSSFRGRGMEFDEVRPYQLGDDVRTLDWRVMARSGKPHTKLFREERERAVLLSVDYRASMFFATRGAFKSVIAARAAALLAWAAVQHGDRVGGLIYSEQQHQELRPQSGKHAALHLIQRLVDQEQAQPIWSQPGAPHDSDRAREASRQSLLRLRRVARPGSLVVLLGDFRDLDESCELHLSQLARHNDMALFFIYDELEAALPLAGLYRVADGERVLTLDSVDRRACEAYRRKFSERRERLRAICRRHGICFIPCATTDLLYERLRDGLGLRRAA